MSRYGAIVVTGAASGIGAATVAHLRSRGRVVAGIDLVGTGTDPADPRLADVTDAEAVTRAIERIDNEVGPVRGLVTCAGIIRVEDALEVPAEEFRQVLDVNVTGTFLAAQAAARVMARHGCGSIVTIASVSGVLAAPHRAAYSASKGAVIAMTRALALDLAPRGIRVNAVAPGSTETPLLRSVQSPALREAVLASVPLGRLGQSAEIAEVVEYLLGDGASFVTGQTLAVDGGQSVQAGWRLPEEES
ncbi:MAG: SDR family NAD(P)-dependent oxidoreductase [Microbacterium gubbeenense]